MAYGKQDRSGRLADGTGGLDQIQRNVPGKRTLTGQLPRDNELAGRESEATFAPTDRSEKETPNGAGQGPLPSLDAGVITAERAAGRGDSDAAVLALGQLVKDASDPLELARAECTIATGSVESPLRIQVWVDALTALAPDARAGWARALRSRRSPLTFDAALEKLRGMTRQRADAVAIVNAYRVAGRPTDAAAVEQLAALLRANDRSIAAVETILGGVGTDVSIVDEEDPDATTPVEMQTATEESEEAILARLPADHAAAYRAALALLDGKPRSRTTRSTTGAKTRTRDQTRTDKVDSKERSIRSSGIVASGGGKAGGSGRAVRIKAEAFEGIADAQKNAHLAMLLLVACGVPVDLAEWVATCSGTPPDRVRELESMKATMEAGTVQGSRLPIPPRAQQEGGYRGYRIFNAAGTTMTAAEIDAALTGQGFIEVSLDEAFYQEHIAPLLESPERWAWVRADLIALSYQREIDALEERARTELERTGRHDPALMQRILRLKGMRLQVATYAADLRSGKTSVTAEMGKFDQEIRRLDALIADANAKLADARRRLSDDLGRRRSEASLNGTQRRATGTSTTFDPVQPSAELSREVAELEQYIADRVEERSSTEQMMGTGDEFPDQLAAQRQRALGQRYETTDGSFKFRSNARATVDAVDGALASVSARLWAGMGGTAEYGGAALSFLTGEPWFGQIGEDLSRRAYSVSSEIDVYAAGRTARAEEVLGKTATSLIQVATSTAIYVVMLGPVAAGGGVIGAALIGGRIGATAGSIAALATTGALMSSDQGGAEMAKGAVLMGAMPLFAGFGATALRRAVSAFIGNAAMDGASQMDLHAAYTAYERTRSYKDALAAATERVDMSRMFANGLMGALLAGDGGGRKATTTGDPPLLRVGDEHFRPDGSKVTDAAQIRAESKVPPVKVNRAELDSIQAMQKSGDTEGALDLIARARTRGDAVAESSAEVKKTESSIARLEGKATTEAQQQQLGELRARRDRTSAQAEVLAAAQEGRPISRALLEKSGGQVPLGYAEATPGGDYVPQGGLAARQSAAFRAQLQAGTEVAGQYRTELDAMNRLSRELVAEQARPAPRAEVLTRLRSALAAAAEKVRALRAAFDRAVGRGDTKAEVDAVQSVQSTTSSVETPIAVDDGAYLGGGGQASVYAVDVDGAAMAVKVPRAGGRVDLALEGALLPTRYGGLGGGKIVPIQMNGVTMDAVLMPRVEGTTLTQATTVTAAQRDAFRGYMENALKDAVVLGDLNPSNILLRKDGGVTVIDAPAVTIEKFGESMRAVEGDAATPQRLAEQWKAARELFQWKVERTLREMDAKLEGTPRGADDTRLQSSSKTQVERDAAVDPSKADQSRADQNTADKSTVEKTDARDVRPTEEPPMLDDVIIRDIAARTEADVNNIVEGTCATAALRNTISAQLRGMKAYVVEIEGLTALGRVLERLGVREGNVGKILERLGAETTSAHAVAAIQGADGTFRYVSWGRVETDLAVFAREAYGDAYLRRGTWETGDHVQWMTAHKWEYPNPTLVGRAQRALFGWMIKTGK